MHRRIRIYVGSRATIISYDNESSLREETNERKEVDSEECMDDFTSENASCRPGNIDVNGGNGGENGQRISLIIYRIRCHVSSPPRFKGISLEEKNPRRPTHARACNVPCPPFSLFSTGIVYNTPTPITARALEMYTLRRGKRRSSCRSHRRQVHFRPAFAD